MKKILLVALVALAGFKFSFAQSDVADMLRFGTHDANLLIGAYVEPYAKGLGVGMNNSWYYTAETHKLWGFDLAFSVSAFKVADSDKTFDVNKLGLKYLYAQEGNSIASTAAGSTGGVPLYYDANYQGMTIPVEYFSTPGGSDFDVVPVPIIQASFGLLPNTDIIGRYIPKVKFDIDNEKADVGLWGIGFKHNIRKSLPFIKHLPIDIALFAAYSKMSGESTMHFDYTNYGYSNPAGYVVDENQRGELESKNFKYGLIVSKKIAVITFFASVTGNSSKTTFDILGRFPIPDPERLSDDYTSIDDLLIDAMVDEEDPIALHYKDNYIGLDAGFRLKLAFFSLFGSIAKTNYVTYNAGLSFGFR
ncbi:DUF6588 family protein [Mangrovibacterium diazotrophicum]|uniref:Uncharacterized protein n=1 Tax=Mangrovibacterium diazotrophicum TaxID=1261403 RepID=A0A419W590_9BACT|nr:DUF6588 family protein [Mangrovibacterium diazotrophicum]RKD90614.1 hypothetical protein BC643_0954 [Mangrovibacterium diazotrophicum]